MKQLLVVLLLLGFPMARLAFAQAPGVKPVLTPAPESEQTAPSTQPAGQKTGSPLTMVDPSYVIGPEDSIQVNVWKEPTFSGALLVRPDGMVTLPALGDVPAAGRTPMQLAADITTLLKKLVIDPTVTVTVLAVNSKHIFLIGEVGHIGPLPMTPGMNVLQAIASAGGLGPYANKKHIYIQRMQGGKELKIPFDYNKAVKNGDMQGIKLQPDDTIVVPD